MVTSDLDHLILDWNGTLIDDVDLAVDCVNHLRRERDLPVIERHSYRDAFGFPIRDFYARIGFDFSAESFESVVQGYLKRFNARIRYCSLYAGGHELIRQARRANITVSLLSASHSEILAGTLRHHDLLPLFDHVMGLENSEASGKSELARILDHRLGHPRERALMIGDSDHDLEVAADRGWQVAIVAHGHQSEHRFDVASTSIFPDFESLSALFERSNSSEHVQRSEIKHAAS